MNFKTLSRRDLIARVGLVAAAASIPGLMSADIAFAEGRPDGKHFSPRKALQLLTLGNARWAAKKPIRKNYAPKGVPIEEGQWPLAAIVGCADSRVHPNELFDVAPANLFVVRNAGNVVDEDVLGSLEYAVEHLGVGLIVALGHSGCGAVKATEAAIASGTMPGGHITDLVEKIAPALTALPAGHSIGQAIHANAAQSAEQIIEQSEILKEAHEAGKLLVVSGAYNLKTRKVRIDE